MYSQWKSGSTNKATAPLGALMKGIMLANDETDLKSKYLAEEPTDATESTDLTSVEAESETWQNTMLRPDRPLAHRHREIARLAAHGKKQKYIAKKLGYTQSRVSLLLSSPKIQNEVERIRDKLFAIDLETRMKDLSEDAMDAIEDILLSPHVNAKDKESAAKWVLEKTTGKATQQVDVKGEVSIGLFLDKLDRMKSQDQALKPSAEPIDITPNMQKPSEDVENVTTETQDSFSTWLDKNLS